MITSDKIYKVDSNGNMRVWYYEVEDNKWRSCAGVLGGKLMVGAWKVIDRARSQDTEHDQAVFEANAHWQNKLDREYYLTQEKAKEGKPKIIQPMLARKYEEKLWDKLKPARSWVQPKLDGIRAVITPEGAFTRAGKVINSIPHILEQLEPFFELHPEVILDGELYNHEMKEDFQTIQSIVRKSKCRPEEIEMSAKMIQFHCYDAIAPGNWHCERAVDFMLWHAENIPHSVRWVEGKTVTSHEEVLKAMADYIEQGYEGAMWRLEGEYEGKRSKHLYKVKEFQDKEFKIAGIEEGRGQWAGHCKRVNVIVDPEIELISGCGTQGTMPFLKEVYENRDKWIADGWVTARFMGYTDEGRLRFGVVTKYHEGGRTE